MQQVSNPIVVGPTRRYLVGRSGLLLRAVQETKYRLQELEKEYQEVRNLLDALPECDHDWISGRAEDPIGFNYTYYECRLCGAQKT